MANTAMTGFNIARNGLAALLEKAGMTEYSALLSQSSPSVHVNPIQFYRSHIAKQLASIVNLYPSIIVPVIQRTSTLEKGDLVLPIPALRIKEKSPLEVADIIREKLTETPLIEKPVVEGTFVQFFFKREPLSQILVPFILSSKGSYGFDPTIGLSDPNEPNKGRKKIIVEFGSPNIAKPFHASHLRSTIIGGFLANLYERAGWEVIRMNYLGDWGKQYGVLGVGFSEFGSEEALQRDAVGHLFDVYVKISAIARSEQQKIQALRAEITDAKKIANGSNETVDEMEAQLAQLQATSVDEKARQYFKRMCDGDQEALDLWSKFRDLSIVKYRETFARLNIQFDIYAGESQIKETSMQNAARVLEEKRLAEESEGAVIVDLTKYSKKLGKAIVRKKDGTSIYLTRDIGAVYECYETHHYDKMIYVIAAQQDLHMAQLIKIIELMGRKDLAEKLQHVNFGLVLGMSTRRGTVKFLDDILRDCADKMHEVMRSNPAKYSQLENPEQIADILGISAVLVLDMNSKRINNYTFNMDRMTSFEGDTGPYLQYSHARLSSIIRKANETSQELDRDGVDIDFAQLKDIHAANILRRLAQWPEIFELTYKSQEPVTVLAYLWKLTHAINSSYDHLNVINSEPDVKLARLALYACAREVLANAMKLLGLTPVERM